MFTWIRRFFSRPSRKKESYVCRCNKVSKQEIIHRIQQGDTTIQSIKKSTKAATGCGYCTSQVLDIIAEHTS